MANARMRADLGCATAGATGGGSCAAGARWGLALALLALAGPAAAALENKWRLQFSGNAESDGVLVLAVDPWGRPPPVLVRVEVAAGTSENGVARAARDALRAAVGDDYDVELDDGEDVLLNRRLFRRRFEVRVEENSVRGLRVNRDQE